MVAYFDQYWKSNSGNDESFWAHEWNKHGTCISSLETQCFVGYQDQVSNLMRDNDLLTARAI